MVASLHTREHGLPDEKLSHLLEQSNCRGDHTGIDVWMPFVCHLQEHLLNRIHSVLRSAQETLAPHKNAIGYRTGCKPI